jgi:hypothetical protein
MAQLKLKRHFFSQPHHTPLEAREIASAGIADTLLARGRTAHPSFYTPLLFNAI